MKAPVAIHDWPDFAQNWLGYSEVLPFDVPRSTDAEKLGRIMGRAAANYIDDLATRLLLEDQSDGEET